MGLLGDTKVKALVAGLVLSVVLLVGIAAFGLLAALSALGDSAGGAPLLFVLLDAAAPYIVAGLLDAMVAGVLAVALAVTAVRRASLPRNDRLARLAETVERASPKARSVGLSDRVAPTTEDRIDDLKQRYVEGDIGELEYERRLQELMDDESVDADRVRRERSDREFEL
ncbi:SHOCT domain-containing protein [Halomicrococcus sp. SG-WS-1]|uniref:SHOCT domain-containing protein n=1 Tax=Halomicrococcus sp. SG-WS-1 TaxID=3439057 RepID=UPI003F7ACD89